MLPPKFHWRVTALLLGLSTARVGVSAEPPAPRGIAATLIARYHMQRIPEEGVWFALTYVSDDVLAGNVLPQRYSGRAHAMGSAILVVETPRDFSALHRLKTDEVWHFYKGSPIEMLLLYPDGHGRKIVLGPNVLAAEQPQFTVPHGVWQGSSPRGHSSLTYSFVGDQLSPGFDYADFELGDRGALVRDYPSFAADIARLTRTSPSKSPAHDP